uniref:Uncharacterized protein n=2 Tax=Ditylum brightwellii TaxID=49249 RepID=A0A7S4QI94_9STRA
MSTKHIDDYISLLTGEDVGEQREQAEEKLETKTTQCKTRTAGDKLGASSFLSGKSKKSFRSKKIQPISENKSRRVLGSGVGDTFVPKQSTRVLNSKKIQNVGDGDTWMEIVVVNSRRIKGHDEKISKSLYYSLNNDIAVFDEPPSGASRVITSPDSWESLQMLTRGRKKGVHRRGDSNVWVEICILKGLNTEELKSRSLFYCIDTCAACWDYPPNSAENVIFRNTKKAIN